MRKISFPLKFPSLSCHCQIEQEQRQMWLLFHISALSEISEARKPFPPFCELGTTFRSICSVLLVLHFATMFSIDGAFVSTNLELPDISTQNSTKAYQKGHKSEFFIVKMTSGKSVVAVFLRRGEHYFAPLKFKEDPNSTVGKLDKNIAKIH